MFLSFPRSELLLLYCDLIRYRELATAAPPPAAAHLTTAPGTVFTALRAALSRIDEPANAATPQQPTEQARPLSAGRERAVPPQPPSQPLDQAATRLSLLDDLLTPTLSTLTLAGPPPPPATAAATADAESLPWVVLRDPFRLDVLLQAACARSIASPPAAAPAGTAATAVPTASAAAGTSTAAAAKGVSPTKSGAAAKPPPAPSGKSALPAGPAATAGTPGAAGTATAPVSAAASVPATAAAVPSWAGCPGTLPPYALEWMALAVAPIQASGPHSKCMCTLLEADRHTRPNLWIIRFRCTRSRVPRRCVHRAG